MSDDANTSQKPQGLFVPNLTLVLMLTICTIMAVVLTLIQVSLPQEKHGEAIIRTLETKVLTCYRKTAVYEPTGRYDEYYNRYIYVENEFDRIQFFTTYHKKDAFTEDEIDAIERNQSYRSNLYKNIEVTKIDDYTIRVEKEADATNDFLNAFPTIKNYTDHDDGKAYSERLGETCKSEILQ